MMIESFGDQREASHERKCFGEIHATEVVHEGPVDLTASSQGISHEF
jgi:hypothetical protein